MTLNIAGNVLWVTNSATGARMGSVSDFEEFKATLSGSLTALTVDPRGLASPNPNNGTLVFTRGNASDSLVFSGYGRVTR
jgi:hypothetical protein